MRFEKIPLSVENEQVYLDAYIADPIKALTRKAILVIPGGGYSTVCADREGEPIAMAFLPYGYNAFVLHYTVDRIHTFPTQLIEVAKAIKHIKDHAGEYNIDPENVFTVGFSAGGHLSACAGTMWKLDAVQEAVDMPYGYNKPTGIMPIYPVISADPAHSHGGSFHNLWGTDEPTQEQLDEVSLEKQVDERSAPCFLVHTADDTVVPVMNSLLFAQAYAACGRTFELHIYPSAPHGMALGNDITALGHAPWSGKNLEKWVEQAALWAELL